MSGEVGVIEKAGESGTADFDAIYRQYQTQIAGYLRRLVGDPEVAADLTQDVFVKAYRAIGSARPGLSVKAWLFTIATNTALDHHRRGRLIRWLPFGKSNHDSSGTSMEADFVATDEVGTALAKLARDQRICLLLHARHGFSYEEIGAMLNISSGAARTNAYRARMALADALRKTEEGAS